jgi:formylglycine-generating enzyme required for sulfatase activity
MLKIPVIVALAVAAVALQAPSSKAPAGDSPLVLQLPGNVPLEMVRIPAGTFTMGSPDSEMKTDEHVGKEPLHRVTIRRPFYLSKYEVMQRQYRALTGTNPSQVQGDDLPVTNVSWEEAVAFARHASEALKRPLRLPTDAEWEYAARAGTGTMVYTGNDEAAVYAAGWCGGNGDHRMHAVGEKPPNAFGLFDMIGNVREWTQDIYGPESTGDVTDPTGPTQGDLRISRGGAYTGRLAVCRAAIRNVEPPTKSNGIIGVRLAMDAAGR